MEGVCREVFGCLCTMAPNSVSDRCFCVCGVWCGWCVVLCVMCVVRGVLVCGV